ncbi:hypothetical protein DITRI_Ditri13aG0100400 [Diplodiscus trichospermus]
MLHQVTQISYFQLQFLLQLTSPLPPKDVQPLKLQVVKIVIRRRHLLTTSGGSYLNASVACYLDDRLNTI